MRNFASASNALDEFLPFLKRMLKLPDTICAEEILMISGESSNSRLLIDNLKEIVSNEIKIKYFNIQPSEKLAEKSKLNVKRAIDLLSTDYENESVNPKVQSDLKKAYNSKSLAKTSSILSPFLAHKTGKQNAKAEADTTNDFE